MAFPNIFKKNPSKAPEKKFAAEKKEKPVQSLAVSKESKKISFGGVSSKILLSPHVTEKASLLVGKNQYIFKVHSEATKFAVAHAIKEAFGADAKNVNIITIHSRERRVGRTLGTKPGFKKAIVTLKEGQHIDLMPQ